MANNRADKNIFPFFNSVSSPVSTTGVSDSFYNNGNISVTFEPSVGTSVTYYTEFDPM